MHDTTIINLRNIIDRLDDEIIANIAKRHQVSKQIGEYKKVHHIEVLDKTREQKLHEYHLKLSQKYKIPQEFVDEIFALIVIQSRSIQE